MYRTAVCAHKSYVRMYGSVRTGKKGGRVATKASLIGSPGSVLGLCCRASGTPAVGLKGLCMCGVRKGLGMCGVACFECISALSEASWLCARRCGRGLSPRVRNVCMPCALRAQHSGQQRSLHS